jgi:hypothetical protein
MSRDTCDACDNAFYRRENVVSRRESWLSGIMRSILFTLFFAFGCAASQPRYINVANVKNEIQGTIRSTTNDRQIHSMGKVTADRAVVYTTSKQAGTKQEETWVKSGACQRV